jgi:hypothetical protein
MVQFVIPVIKHALVNNAGLRTPLNLGLIGVMLALIQTSFA